MQQEEYTRTDDVGQQAPVSTQGSQGTGLPPEEPEHEHHGPAGIAGVIILILLIALGGLYFWSTTIEAPVIEEPIVEEPQTDPVVEGMFQLEESGDLDAIERDLERTDLDAIDTDLDELELELEATVEMQ